MAYGRTFPARRRGTCGECGGQIKRGEEIKWDRSRRIACHDDCNQKGERDTGLAGMTDVDRFQEDYAAEVTREYF